METTPVPKPRTLVPVADAVESPVPLPRSKPPVNNDKISASDILRSIGNVSKQITEDVATKVSSSAKTANDMIEKSLSDGSKFAKGTIKKTINTSRAVRDSVTKSVIEGTKTTTIKLRKGKKSGTISEGDAQRSTSMPAVDMTLFDNIQFHSPLMEQKRYKDEDGATGGAEYLSMNLNVNTFDDLSLFSNNSDSNTDTVSNFSYDSKECEQATFSNSDVHNMTYDTHGSNNMSVHNTMYDTPKGSRANSIAGSMSLPDLPERRQKKNYDVMRQNSLYENWVLPVQMTCKVEFEPKTAVVPRASQSTIFEFDPLNSKTPSNKFQGMSNELLLLESFLVGDYGAVVATDSSDSHEDDFDFAETDYYNPPTPPERYDSLDKDEIFIITKPPLAASMSKDSNSNWYVASDTSQGETPQGPKEEVKPTNTMMQRFSRKLKLDNVLQKPSKNVTPKMETVSPPEINKLPVTHYCGTLLKVVSPVIVEDIFKNTQSRFCMLADQQLICYFDATSGIIKESYLLTNIYALQIVLPVSSSRNDSYCFELWVSNGGPKSAVRKVLFTCGSVSQRRNWAQKIAEHLTHSFLPKYTAEYTRMGWCYLKEGVTGEWRGAWLMLTRRVLLYTNKDSSIYIVDLRKTRSVVLQDADEESRNRCPSETIYNLILVNPTSTVYFRFTHDKLLKDWRYMLMLAAHNNGAYIHHQQLTRENVPVIVDKCLSFIYAHGSLSEGIYRRAGGSCTLSELLERFRRDAWSVQLSIEHHSEHDVAGVLRRFLRDLPESLIPQSQNATLLDAIDNPDESQRFAEYRRVMCSLPVVACNTARKLFAHLHFLQSMSHANKMTAENLASVWAPTIMPPALTSKTVHTAWSSKEVFVVRDLIAHYEAIWEPTEAEKRREAAIRRVLMRVLSNSAPTAPKAAGDLKAWIYVKDRTTCHQVALTPSKTAADICIELSEKANTESHLLMLEEVICNESMRRIIHIDEIVLDVVLRWGYWDEEDRKDSYLLLKDNGILHEMESMRHSNSLVCGELKLATESTKAFKLHMFEFQNGCLCYFKDKQGSHKIEEWNIKDIFWYIGHEPKRNPQSRWAITFIPRNKQKRSKEKPWFGVTIAGAVNEDRLKWITALTFGEHSIILPTPRLVIT